MAKEEKDKNLVGKTFRFRKDQLETLPKIANARKQNTNKTLRDAIDIGFKKMQDDDNTPV